MPNFKDLIKNKRTFKKIESSVYKKDEASDVQSIIEIEKELSKKIQSQKKERQEKAKQKPKKVVKKEKKQQIQKEAVKRDQKVEKKTPSPIKKIEKSIRRYKNFSEYKRNPAIVINLLNESDPISSLKKNLHPLKFKILEHMFKECVEKRSLYLKLRSVDLAPLLNSTKRTIQDTLVYLNKSSLISLISFKRGPAGYSEYKFNETLYEKFQRNTVSFDIPISTENVEQPQQSEEQYNVFGMPQEWMDINLHDIQGLTTTHIKQLYKKNQWTVNEVQDSIEAFAFDLENNNKAKKIKGDIVNFFMGIMHKNNSYLPPDNFVSEKERTIRQALALKKLENKRIKEAESELKEETFLSWSNEMTFEQKIALLGLEKQDVKEGAFFDNMLKSHFNEHIWAIEKHKLGI